MPAPIHVAGDVLTAANYNQLPRAQMGYASITASQGSITAETDLTGLSVTWTSPATRLIRTTITVEVGSTVAGDVAELKLTDGSNTQITRSVQHISSTGAATVKMVLVHIETVTSGSKTRKARLNRQGTGTLTASAFANAPAFIVVEDIGAP